jgi:hypothetical protein
MAKPQVPAFRPSYCGTAPCASERWGGDSGPSPLPHIVIGSAIEDRRRQLGGSVVVSIDDGEDGGHACRGEEIRVEGVFRRIGIGSAEDRNRPPREEGERCSSLP